MMVPYPLCIIYVYLSRAQSRSMRACAAKLEPARFTDEALGMVDSAYPSLLSLATQKGRNVHFCKKAPTLAHMTFDRYLSNPDIGRTFWVGLTPSN